VATRLSVRLARVADHKVAALQECLPSRNYATSKYCSYFIARRN